jgi:hypothetical protein
MRVAYIGLGNMGRPMVENILRAGQELTVWNRTRANMEPLIASGVRGASLAREVAQEADVIDLCVSTPDVVCSAVSRSLASVLARAADNQGFLYGCQDRLREVRVKLRSGSESYTYWHGVNDDISGKLQLAQMDTGYIESKQAFRVEEIASGLSL